MSVQLGATAAEQETLVDERETQYHNKKIKRAFRDKDAAASRQHHEAKLHKRKASQSSKDDKYTLASNNNIDDEQNDPKPSHSAQEKKHKGSAGDFIKSIIFGGLDGIITLFAIVASISGSDLKVETVLVLGFAKLVGDGISMGVGDFLSEKAEMDFVKSELEREKWEFNNYKEGEIKEMIEIYKDNGITESDAKEILEIMAKYEEFFINHMMLAELDLDPNVIDDNPLKNGGITFLSFLIFGTIPLLAYLIFYGVDIPEGSTDWKLIIAVILTCVTLFGMGAVKGYYCNSSPIKSGFFVMLNGALAAGSAYLIGWGLAAALGVDHSH